jgi:hypothetical protein
MLPDMFRNTPKPAPEPELKSTAATPDPEPLSELERQRMNQTHELRKKRQSHQHRMEFWRLFIAFSLVATLFAVLAIGLFLDKSGADISQFAAPISGLAGIAVGWLFARREDSDGGRGPEDKATPER